MRLIETGYGSVAELVAAAAQVAQDGGQVEDAFEIAGIFYLRYKEAVQVEKVVVETKVVETETVEKQPRARKGKQQ